MWISGHFGVQFWVCDVIKGISINLLHNFDGTIGFPPSRNIIIPILRLKGHFCCILLSFTWISGHFGVKIRVCDVSKGVSSNLFYSFIVTIGFLPSRNITIPILRLKNSFCCILLYFTWISGHFGVQFGVYDVRKGVNINLFYKSTIIIGLVTSRNINIPILRLKWSFCWILLCFLWISGHFGVQFWVCDVIKGVSINLLQNYDGTIGLLPALKKHNHTNFEAERILLLYFIIFYMNFGTFWGKSSGVWRQ